MFCYDRYFIWEKHFIESLISGVAEDVNISHDSFKYNDASEALKQHLFCVYN